jgi:glycine cleavage system H protein
MTVLLMLCMIVTFLAADKIVRTLRLAKERRQAVQPGTIVSDPPEGIRLALNHTWMKMEKGVAVIGTDEFLARMLGAVESVMLPDVGATVAPASLDIALAHGNRRLRLASPVAGRILEVNTGVLRDPMLARRDPYRSGWLLKVSPDPGRGITSRSVTGAAAREWLRDQMSLAKEFLAGVTPRASFASLPDGGEPAEGALLHCDAAAWEEFERRFTTIQSQEPATT